MTDSIPVVALVDDDKSVCRALTRVIRCAGYCVEAYGSAGEFLQHIGNRAQPACLVLDVHLPDQDGLYVQQALAAAGIIMPIVFISGDGDSTAIVAAMRAGADDFLIKPIPDTRLHDAIRLAVARCASLRAQAAERNAIFDRLSHLTARERDVLHGVLSGRLNKQIAFELGLAEKTIKVYRAHVMEKLGAHSLAHLFHLAHLAGIQAVMDAARCRPRGTHVANAYAPAGTSANDTCNASAMAAAGR